MHCVLEFNQSQWLKPYIDIKTQKQNQRKNGDKDGKALYKLMNNVIYRKTMENLVNRIDIKARKQRKGLFNMYTKSKLYVSQNI